MSKHKAAHAQPGAQADHDKAEKTPEATAASPASAPPTDSNQLQEQLREANDRLLRTQAELENFRKRSRREMEEERRYAPLPFLRDVLNVCDNLQRAIDSAEQSGSAAGLLEGVKMVSLQLNTYLENHHCQQIRPVGEAFDPHLHEAIAQQPSTEYPRGTITNVTRVGYILHDRVVRPAQVIVSTGPSTAAASNEESPANQ